MVDIAQCPECEQDLVFFEEVVSGQYICCNRCGADLEVINADTMQLDWAYRPSDWDGWQELDAFMDAGWDILRRRRGEDPDDYLDD